MRSDTELVWEATVLEAIIRGETRPESGEWDAERVVEALHLIREDRALSARLEGSERDVVIAEFLRIYETLARR